MKSGFAIWYLSNRDFNCVSAATCGCRKGATQRSTSSCSGTGVQVMVFEPALPAADDEMRVFKNLEVLHHAEAGHGELGFQLAQRLAVLLAQAVQKGATGGIVEGFEERIHGVVIGE